MATLLPCSPLVSFTQVTCETIPRVGSEGR